MSTTPEFEGLASPAHDLFDTTEQYVHLRFDAIEHGIGLPAIMAAYDAIAAEGPQPTKVPRQGQRFGAFQQFDFGRIMASSAGLSPAEVAAFSRTTTQTLPDDGGSEERLVDAMEAYDRVAASMFADINGYRLVDAEPGKLRLITLDDSDAGAAIHLHAYADDSRTLRLHKLRITYGHSQALDITPEDELTVLASIERLQSVNKQLAAMQA